jgi:magnesium transporter
MALAPSTTAQGAIDKIRERGELESFFYLYVVDDAGKLVGVVPIRNLVIAPPDRALAEMMIADPVKANVFMDQEEAARLVARYELLALPIVDEGGRLEGIITVDDVIDIINQESTEDMYKMVGLAEEDRVFTPVARSVKMRLPWTMVNLLTATLAASVVGLFEHTLQDIVALVTFMPVVAGVGGNGATQTATVIIRAIALGELEFSSAWKAIVKQIMVNIAIALAAGVLIAVAAVLWKGNPYLGFVLACAMICNLGLMAGFAGAVIPLLLKALKFDPALGSGIIVTGLTDAFGFLSFLGLATIFRAYLI